MNILKSKILILGGNSYIGQAIFQYFIGEVDFELFSYSRTWNDYINELKIKQINGSISDRQVINDLVSIEPHTIINLISLNHLDSELDLKLTIQSNIYPIWKILFNNEFKVLQQVIYLSTIHVYDPKKNERIDENHLPIPENIYGLTHLISEEINSFYGNKNSYKAFNIRLSNTFGYSNLDFEKGKGWEYVINNLVKQAILSRKIIINSNGLPSRDFISLDLLPTILSKIIKSDVLNSGTYNLSKSKNYSIIQIARLIKEIFYHEYNQEIQIYINKTQKVDMKMLESLTNSTEPYPVFSNKKLMNDLALELSDDIHQELKRFIEKLIEGANENRN